MVSGKPSVKPSAECLRGRQKLIQVALGDRVVTLVGRQVAPAAESVDLGRQVLIYAESKRQALQRDRVVTWLIGASAVAAGAQRNGRDAQQRVVTCGETPFDAKLFEPGVRPAALDAASQALDFVALRRVAMQFSDLD
jgi:hypothetical protein